jgi:hypothetical protein
LSGPASTGPLALEELTMSGAFDWLDTLTQQVGAVAGKAVDAYSDIQQNKSTLAAKQLDLQTVAYTSPLQLGGTGGSMLPLLIGGVLVVGVLIFALRK